MGVSIPFCAVGIDDLRGEKCYAALFSLFVGMHSASSSQPENVEG